MKEVTILEKTYIVARHSSTKALTYILKDELKELDVEIKEVSFNKQKYAEIKLEGADEEIAKNLLISNYGTPVSIGDLKEGDRLYGRFKDVGGVKFGLFVDSGIVSSTHRIDALYPLFEMRVQLADNKKVSLMNMINAYAFAENMPLFFEVIKRQVIGSKVWVKISEESLRWLKEPIKKKMDALVICGTTRRAIKQALIETNHFEDIEEMERIGLLEYRLVCKRGTRAEGLIPEIGYLLGRAKIGAQTVARVKDLIKE